MRKSIQKSSFEPINKAHAIVETVFIIHFARNFSDEARLKIKDAFNEFRDLKIKEDVVSFVAGFQPGPGGYTQIGGEPRIVGQERKRMKPDGNIEWLARSDENKVTIHCLDYSRWARVSAKARKYLDSIFVRLSTLNLQLAAIGLKNIDRFVHSGKDNSPPEFHQIFSDKTDLLHSKAFSSGARWHCHIGWFQDLFDDDTFECLNQLNVDAAYAVIEAERRHITTIEHNAFARIKPENQSDMGFTLTKLLARDNNHISKFDIIIDALHSTNKNILGKLLNDEMKRRISLKVDK